MKFPGIHNYRSVPTWATYLKRAGQITMSCLLLLAFVAGPVAADGGGVPQWPANPDWQSYVPGPSSDDVHAVAITRAHGDVTNPEALVGGGGSATLTMEEGGPEAVIVLDYGQEVGGTPYLNISSVSGSPSVRISTSEALPFLNSGGNTSLAADASAGDTNVKVEDVSPFFVGTDITVDEGSAAETRTVTDVGTPATTTSLFSAASPGDTNVKVTSVDGLAVGSEVDVDLGAPDQEHITLTNVGTAGVATTVSAPNTTGGGLTAPDFSDANWIWNTANAQDSAPSGTIYVRKTFNIPDASAVSSAVLGIAVDDEQDTYVNGTLVSSLHISNGWQTFSVTDIKPYLVTGTNVIAVAATNGSGAGSLLSAFDIDGSHNVSDSSWKALAGTPASPPAGWNTAGFDDSSWPAAFVSGPYGIGPWDNNVSPPPGPTTLEVSSVSGFDVGDQITIDTGANQETRTVTDVNPGRCFPFGCFGPFSLTVDSDLTIVHGTGALVLDQNKPGTGIDFTPALANSHDIGTTLSSLGSGVSFSPALSSSHAAGTTVTGLGAYVNDNGNQINFNNISSPDAYTGGLRGGFRFEAIELRTPGTVELSGAGLNFKAYRATPTEYEGWFISSDDQLNRMWYAGAYTAQMDMVPVGVSSCFTKPVIFDGAKRDRAIWSGDLTISDPVALLSLGSNAAPYVTGSVDAFMDLQASSGRLTSAVGFRSCGGFDYAVTYSNYAAIIAIQYYRYTGDTAYITGLLPNLEAATAYTATTLDGNGLVVTNDNDYWQTTQNGEVTEYNLSYYELLHDMIWLESHVGTQAMVDQYTADAAALKDAINTHLFNTDVNLYQHTDSDVDTYPLDANMNAVRLGVAPADQVQHILDYFKAAWVQHGSEISQPSPSLTDPYGHTIEPLNNTWEMLARLQSNNAADALNLMRRLWGLQVDPNSGFYTGTFWEFVLANGLPSRGFDSLAHAWGAGPTQILTEAVIGATAVDPGYKTFQVKPQPVDLGWAEGQVPTAFGPMIVKWAQDTGTGMFHLEVTAPEGTGGEVWIPVGSAPEAASVVLAGDATLLRRDGEYDVYSVGVGTFEFLTVDFPSLKDLVSSFSSKPGVANALNAKIDAAANASNPTTRDNILNAFINQVNAQTGKALTQEEADLLILLAQALM
jgi:hypothetical protein